MNVIIINDYAYINGGAGQVAISSAVALATKGHKVTLFTAVGPIDDKFTNYTNLQIVCVKQYDILNDPNRLRAIVNGCWNTHAANELREVLAGLDINDTIVHVHTCSKALSTSCIRMAIKLGFKIIYHMHDYGLACPNLGFYNYKNQTICKVNPLSITCLKTNCDSRSYGHKLWRYLRQNIQQKFGLIPNGIINFIAVSEFSCNILKPFLPSNSLIHFIRNPIDVVKHSPISVENNKYFVFIGRLTPEKNPILLAKVAKKISLPVIFVGSGSCEQEIKEVCPHAIITGWLTFDKVQEHVQKAKCLVLTSAWYETQGMVVAEAAAKGIPAVVPDTCAAKDFIKDGYNGYIFKSKDENDLADKLIRFNDVNNVKAMGKCAYEMFWKEKMDMNSYIENITEVYKKVLE